jgi:hypothetical protein
LKAKKNSFPAGNACLFAIFTIFSIGYAKKMKKCVLQSRVGGIAKSQSRKVANYAICDFKSQSRKICDFYQKKKYLSLFIFDI